ncbi:MAG: Uma2 family endonuclease [Nostocaceae cyanobacterium]|nr:Uma2 family endonuclease [Nostocaceae cyanobacterium]
MNTTAKLKMTFEEYLTHDDGTDTHYELVAGELVEMPPESRDNSKISLYLLLEFSKFLPLEYLCHKDTEIEVTGTRAQTRIPDLMVLSDEGVAALGNRRGTITRDMPPPVLVVEVVSPGQQNEERDYRYKRSEYAARGISEYWIIAPLKGQVLVLTLISGLYEEKEYTGDQLILSRFPELQVTAAQVLRAGK